MKFVVTVTPNAALDNTMRLEELRLGQRNRVRSAHVQAGGKGVNVARVLARLGVPVRSVVVVGGETGLAIRRDLAQARLEPVVVEAPGESRTCVEVIEDGPGRTTQIHGAGVRAGEQTAQALVATVAASLDGAGWTRSVARSRLASPKTSTRGSVPSRARKGFASRSMRAVRR